MFTGTTWEMLLRMVWVKGADGANRFFYSVHHSGLHHLHPFQNKSESLFLRCTNIYHFCYRRVTCSHHFTLPFVESSLKKKTPLMRIIWWHSLPLGNFLLYRLSGRDRACAPCSPLTERRASPIPGSGSIPRLGVSQASANKSPSCPGNGEVFGGRRRCLRKPWGSWGAQEERGEEEELASPLRAAPDRTPPQETHPTVAVVE